MFSRSSINKITAGPAAFLAWSAVFALVYTQLPLFNSNQYTYFLHGLANAGYGFLSNDWLARTADPTPIFSLLVEFTYRVFHSEAPVYIYYGLLLGVYFYALYGIADFLFGLRGRPLLSLAFLTAFLAIHSTVFRFILSRIWDGETAYLFEGGVAEQRVLGQIFQPSSFGVFLLLSVLFFLRGKKGFSILALAAAVYFHSTYLLAGALLTLGYLAAIVWKDRSWKSALRFGSFALLAVAPVVIYDIAFFGPASAEIYRQAAQILAHFRVAQHAEITWFRRPQVIPKAVLFAAALWAVRKTRLFPIMIAAFLGMLVLMAADWATGSDSLALLFPWRISTILVPLSTAILLAAGLQWLAGRISPPSAIVARIFPTACLAVIAILLAAGIARFPLDQAAAASDPALPMMTYVRLNAQPGDVYFIPSKMESFRFETGAPAFVDLKSSPYRDTEVVEWYRRLTLADDYYLPGTDRCAQSAALAKNEGLRLFVIPTEAMPFGCTRFEVLYQDAEYTVVSVLPEPAEP